MLNGQGRLSDATTRAASADGSVGMGAFGVVAHPDAACVIGFSAKFLCCHACSALPLRTYPILQAWTFVLAWEIGIGLTLSNQNLAMDILYAYAVEEERPKDALNKRRLATHSVITCLDICHRFWIASNKVLNIQYVASHEMVR